MKKNQIMAGLAMLALSGSLLAQTLVTVNGAKIDSSEVERRVKSLQAQNQVPDSPELRQYILNQLVTEKLVTQEARKLKLDKTDAYKQAETELRQQAKQQGLDKAKDFKENWALQQDYLLMNMYAHHIVTTQPISEADMKKEYDDYVAHYKGSDEVQLGEILTNDAAQAQAAIKDLNAKKSFADTVKKYSIDEQVKAAGGVIPDYVPLPDLKETNQDVYNAVVKLDKGQYTKTPISNNNLHLILYVNDKRKFEAPKFEELKPAIENNLRQMQLSRTLDTLGEQAKIEVAK